MTLTRRLKWIKMFLSILTLAIFLTACGGTQSTQQNSGASSSQNNQATSKPEDTTSLFAGKTITFIVPFGPGGGYDTYARLLQPYIEKYSGATVVVQNISGSGGISGVNKLYRSDPDGLTIGIIPGANSVYSQISATQGVNFEADKFTYLGRVSGEPNVMLVSTKSPYQSFEDFKAADHVKLGITAVGTDHFYTWSVLYKAFGVENYEWVGGWEGTSQWLAAVATGELDGGPLSLDSGMALIENGQAFAALQVAPERDSRIPDTPTASEMLPEDHPNQSLIRAITNILVADRVLAAPPGMDDSVINELRKIVDQALNDEEFVAQAEQSGRLVAYLSGEEVQNLIEDAMKFKDELKPIFDEAIAKEQQ